MDYKVDIVMVAGDNWLLIFSDLGGRFLVHTPLMLAFRRWLSTNGISAEYCRKDA